MKIAGVILAAGASRRMGQPKSILQWERGSFLDHLMFVFDLPVDPVVIVVREGDVTTQRSCMAKYARVVVNPDAERGQLSSLQCGLAALPSAPAFAFCPVDHPAVEPRTMKELIRVFETSKALVVIPRFETRHGHPVLIRRRVADDLLAAPPTSSTRDVLHRYSDETHYVSVNDPGVVADIDTPDEYRAMRQKFGLSNA